MRPHPMWLKAPLLLFRWPPILAAIAAGITILVLSTAVAPLFLSSAAGGALADGLEDLPPSSAGLSLGQGTPFQTFTDRSGSGRERVTPLELHARRTEALRVATADLEHLGPPIATAGTGESVLISDAGSVQVQPLAREGFESHIEVDDSTSGPGAWVARGVADELGIRVGDVLDLEIDRATTVRIKGIYSDLHAVPITPFWLPVDRFIHAPVPKAPIPPAPLLMEIPELLELGEDSRSFGFEAWEFPLEAEGLTLDQARRLSRQMGALTADALDQDSDLGSLFSEPNLSTTLPEVVDGAAETVTGVSSPVQVLALIGGLVAMVLIAISAHYVVQKRSIEFRLLEARGVSGGWVAARSIAETFVVAILCGAIGTGIAIGSIRAFGPGPLDATAIRRALVLGAGALIVALVVLGIATANAAAKKTAVERVSGSHDAGFPWEVVLLVIAGLALYLIDRRGAIAADEGGSGRVDILLVVFPLVGISGAALFLLRIGFSFLNRARGATESAGIALFLAARRLAAASRSVMLFVGAAAVSVGMLVYSTGLVSSVKATTYAKTHVFVGSDVSIVVSDTEPLDLSFPYTYVNTIDGDVGSREVDVMGIDPASFASAAYWDEDFASTGLDAMVDEIASPTTESLPVIVAGDEEWTPDSFSVFGHETPIEVVGRARTWPGMSTARPALIAAIGPLGEAASEAGFSIAVGRTDLWVKGPPDAVLAGLHAADVDTQASVSARDAAESSALLSISWTFGLLRILGIGAGVMSILGMLLYVAGRHRARLVSYLLGRRMGLQRSSHRSALLLEFVAMLTAALALGGLLGLLATRLIYRSLDLLPSVPPSPLFRVPVIEIVLAGVVFALAAFVGSRSIQRLSDRVRPGEVMRLAD